MRQASNISINLEICYLHAYGTQIIHAIPSGIFILFLNKKHTQKALCIHYVYKLTYYINLSLLM